MVPMKYGRVSVTGPEQFAGSPLAKTSLSTRGCRTPICRLTLASDAGVVQVRQFHSDRLALETLAEGHCSEGVDFIDSVLDVVGSEVSDAVVELYNVVLVSISSSRTPTSACGWTAKLCTTFASAL